MTRSPDEATAAVDTGSRRRAGLGLLLAAVLAGTACGQQAPDATADRTAAVRGDTPEPPRVSRLLAGDEQPRLGCPTGARRMMVADFVPDAKGAATPEKALARERLKGGERLVISRSGTKAWVVRADGTAKKVIGLMELGGWVVNERESCG